jgi:hypothetical protein
MSESIVMVEFGGMVGLQLPAPKLGPYSSDRRQTQHAQEGAVVLRSAVLCYKAYSEQEWQSTFSPLNRRTFQVDHGSHKSLDVYMIKSIFLPQTAIHQ